MRRRRHRRQPNKQQTQGNEQFLKPTVQAKLSMGKPGDKYEVEADKMADQVVNKSGKENSVQKKGEVELQQKPLASTITPLVQKMEASDDENVQAKQDKIQRMEEEETVQQKEEEEAVQMKEEDEVQAKEEEEGVQMKEEEEVQAKEEEEAVQMKEDEEVQAKEEEESVQKMEDEEVQAKSNNNQNAKNSSIENRLKNGSGGQKMDANTQQEMESGFGADFNRVNIHTNSEAEQMSQDIGAQAFTHGNNIYFNKGKYDPNSKEGKHLLAHELTHTIQQKGMVQKKLQKKDAKAGRFKRDKDISKALNNTKYIRLHSTGAQVTTLQKALIDAGYSLPKNGVSGVFDAETETAVKAYQKDNGLKVDGIVGPETMGHFDKDFAGTVTTKRYTKWYKEQIKLYKNAASFPFHIKIMNFFYKTRNFHVIQMLNDKSYKVKTFTGATDYWKDDITGKITKTDLSKSLRGNTVKRTNTIRLNKNLPIEKAAMTLYHELHHAFSKEPDYLKQEIEVRIASEQFAIDNNLSETAPNYRTKSGEVDKKYIENQINGSSHYNPTGRSRVKRTYSGEKFIGPWIVP